MSLINKIPKTNNTISSYKVLKNETQNLSYLITLGCLTYRISDPKRRKLDSQAYECIFIKYAENSKVYTFIDLEN